MAQDKFCGGCKSSQMKFLFSLGEMPPVNAFISKSDIPKEESFPLNLYFCEECKLVQLGEVVSPDKLFSNYLHLSSASKSNIQHLDSVSRLTMERFKLGSKSKVLEIGSNDGTLLSFMAKKVKECLGVDPAKNLSDMAKKAGVETLTAFFGENVADDILKSRGQFDAILALNVIPHTADFMSSLRGVRKLLSPNGAFFMEGAYVVDTILVGQFDTIYHEHVYNFSLHSLMAAFERAGLKILDAEIIPTQGTSIRVTAARSDSSEKISSSVEKILKKEKAEGFTDSKAFATASEKVRQFKVKLRDKLNQYKKAGKSVAALGAPARGVVVMNYCEVSERDLKYVIDDTPLKQGKVMPGTHIPVFDWDQIRAKPCDIYLLLSWNYKKEILEKFKKAGGKGTVITIFPEMTETSV